MENPSKRRVFLACDGFGEDLKNAMKDHIASTKPEFVVEDLGTDTYFDAAGKVGKAMMNDTKEEKDQGDYGLLVCGTGMGVGMVANQWPGVRAATVESVRATRSARAINDANVICLGQLVTSVTDAKEMVDAFFEQKFMSQPTDDDGKAVDWWSKDVENFLSTSKEGLKRVEKQAMESSFSSTGISKE